MCMCKSQRGKNRGGFVKSININWFVAQRTAAMQAD